jgi:YesN/AraC family two-component response regulator
LNDYFKSDKPLKFGTPTVAFCAEQLHLSANYFGDLIKKETGVSAQEYILSKTMETAKEMLADPSRSVSDVAYALGYQYPQYFSKAFKRIVGYPPNEYRSLN